MEKYGKLELVSLLQDEVREYTGIGVHENFDAVVTLEIIIIKIKGNEKLSYAEKFVVNLIMTRLITDKNIEYDDLCRYVYIFQNIGKL